MCPAPSLWATLFRRAQPDRRGFWNRSWSMNFCSSNSSTFTWSSTTPTDPWRGCSLTSRLLDPAGVYVETFKPQNLCPTVVNCSLSCTSFQTRFPTLENPESLRKSADDFLTQAAMTDAGLLFPPSQIALAAILNSALRAGLGLERYCLDRLPVSGDLEIINTCECN